MFFRFFEREGLILTKPLPPGRIVWHIRDIYRCNNTKTTKRHDKIKKNGPMGRGPPRSNVWACARNFIQKSFFCTEVCWISLFFCGVGWFIAFSERKIFSFILFVSSVLEYIIIMFKRRQWIESELKLLKTCFKLTLFSDVTIFLLPRQVSNFCGLDKSTIPLVYLQLSTTLYRPSWAAVHNTFFLSTFSLPLCIFIRWSRSVTTTVNKS